MSNSGKIFRNFSGKDTDRIALDSVILPEWLISSKKTLFRQALNVFAHPVKHLRSYSGDLSHTLLLLFLATLLMLFDVFLLRYTFPDKDVPENIVTLNMTIAILIIPFSLFICFCLPYIFLPFKKRSSWIISIFVLLLAFSIEGFLVYQICYKGILEYSKSTNWPVPLIVARDSWAFFAFSVLFVTNTWNYVHAIRAKAVRLMGKMPKIDFRKEFENPSLPTIIIPVPLGAYILIISVAVVVLIMWEAIVVATFHKTFPGTHYAVTFGLLKDTIGVFIECEVFIWYYFMQKRLFWKIEKREQKFTVLSESEKDASPPQKKEEKKEYRVYSHESPDGEEKISKTKLGQIIEEYKRNKADFIFIIQECGGKYYYIENPKPMYNLSIEALKILIQNFEGNRLCKEEFYSKLTLTKQKKTLNKSEKGYNRKAISRLYEGTLYKLKAHISSKKGYQLIVKGWEKFYLIEKLPEK